MQNINHKNDESNNIVYSRKQFRFLALFLHPIDRAALVFHQYKQSKSAADPNYDSRIEHVSLKSFAEYLLSTNDENIERIAFPVLRYKMSNFLTKALMQSSKSTITASTINNGIQQHGLNDEIKSIINVLRDQCIVGLVEELEETFNRYTKIINHHKKNYNNNIDPNNDMENMNDCISKFVTKQIDALINLRDDYSGVILVPKGSVEWNALEKLNQEDIYLYERIKEIFIEQGQVLFSGYD